MVNRILAKAAAEPDDVQPDPARADDAEGFPVQVEPSKFFKRKAPDALGRGHLAKPAREGEDEGERVLRDRILTISRDRAGDDAPFPAGHEIDVVVTRRARGDEAQLWVCCQKSTVDSRPEKDDDHLRVLAHLLCRPNKMEVVLAELFAESLL